MRKKSASLSLRETVALFREVRHGTERRMNTVHAVHDAKVGERKGDRDSLEDRLSMVSFW